MKELILFLCLVSIVINFTFLYPSISVSVLTINTPATYTFYAFRNQDDNLNPTPYSTQQVPALSTIIIIFPAQYNLVTSVPVCTSLLINDNSISGFTTSISGNNFIISNAILTNSAIANVTIVCSNVLNPYPAITTDPFIIKIGQDISSSSSTITLTAGALKCNITFSPAFVNTTGAMVLYLQPQTYILNNGFIEVQFPSSRQWSFDASTDHYLGISSATCSILSGQVLTGSCLGSTATTSFFQITSINSTRVTQPFSFQINSLFSPPYTTPTDSIIVTSYSSDGSQIDTCTTTITGLIPQILSVSLNSNSNPFYVNSNSSITFTFTLPDTLVKTDYFQIVFPSGTIFAYNNVISGLNLLLFPSGVTYTSSNLTLKSRQSISSPTRNAGTVCKITVGTYTAPPSVKATGNFILQVYNAQDGLKMQGTATMAAQANLYSMNVSAATYFINQNTIFTFSFTSTDFLTNTAYITLTFPAELTLNLATQCLTSNFSSPAVSTCTLNGSNTIRLGNLTNNGISANTYTMSIQSVINPNKAISSLYFTSSFYYINDSSYLVATSNFTGLTFLPNMLSLNSTTVSLSDYHVLMSSVSANLTFTTRDAIAANGYMLIQIPSQISIVASYSPQCIYTSGAVNLATPCTIIGQVFNVSFDNRAITANQTITIGLNNFGINPKSTRPTSSFQLYLYSPDGYLVNYLNSSLTVANLLPIDFSFITISPSNYTNSAITAYTFYFQHTASWDNNSYLIIQVPPSIAFTNTTPLCTNSNTNASLTCNIINGTNLNVSLANSALSLSLSVLLKNPPSKRPSANFVLTTYTADGYIYSTNNLISISTTSPSTLTNLTYSFSNPYYNQSTNLTLNINNFAAITTSYTLTNANQFISGVNITCSSSVVSAVTCVLSGSILTIVASSSTFPITADVTIMNLLVPMGNVSQMTLNSFDDSYLFSTFSPISFQTGCSLPCYTCTSPSTPLVCLSCYPNTQFTNKIYYYSNNCYNSCPVGSFNTNGSAICSTCSNPCAQCLSAGSNCTECVANSTNPILYLSNNTCIATCPSGTFKDNSTNLTKYTPICSTCLPPCSTCIAATICLSCLNSSLYYYNNQCNSTCPSLITIANATSMQCDLCANICLTCINTTTTCLSCNFSVAPIYLAQNQTCVSSCPSPLVVDGNNCSSCASPCSTCSNVKTNCTSCVNGTYLSLVLNGTCLSVCDQFFFGNSTTLQCQSCITVSGLNCQNCLDSTRCKTCDTGFVFFSVNSSCLSQTPSGYTNVSGIAVACISNCSQCSYVSYNCTGCTGLYNFYMFAGTGFCQVVCPNTTLAFNNTCNRCTYPCLSCSSSLSNCTTCITGYLIPINSSLTCIVTCPNYTYLDPTTSVCTNCSSLCLTCLGSALQCTSCLNSSEYISNSTCVSSCPNNSLVNTVTRTCYSCLSPCLTCLNSANNCTSCNNGFYFISSLSQCLASCPAPFYVADPSGAFICVSCSNNCYKCSILQNNCTECISNYSLYNNACTLACPSGFYSSLSICTACVNNCSTCTSSTACLTCSNSALFYQSQCLSTCPVDAAIIVNNTCTPCSNSCQNCSSSNFCYACPSSSALYNGACVTSCPAPLSIYYNTSSNKLECFTNSQIAAQNLQDTLQITSVLPLPFTIITTFLFLCCLMSKIQNMETYIIGVGYSLYGISEAASLGFLLYIYNIGYFTYDDYPFFFKLIVITLCMIGFLNIISLFFVTPFLVSDPQFSNWLNYKRRGTPQKDSMNQQSSEDVQTDGGEKQNQSVQCCSHKCTFAFFTISSFVTSYKFRIIIFSKLFKFNCLTAHLQNIHGFRAFNVLSFFGIIHEGFAIYIMIKFLLNFGLSDKKLYLATIDCFIVTLISFILALMATLKDDDFFRIHNDFKNGIDLGHRKKDKDLKNYKLDQKRLKGMNSRDKLIDIGEEHSQIDDEQIIVNHNIINANKPKKTGSQWVQVDENKKKTNLRSPRSPRDKGPHNIFQVGEQYDEDRYVPMTQKDRIQLFHTSVKPNKMNLKTQSKPVQSRVDDWVQVNLDEYMLKDESKIKANQKSSRHFIQNSEQELIVRPVQSKKLNLQQSTVKIAINDNFSKMPPRQPTIVSLQPIIKETDSQYIIGSNSNKNNPSQKELENIPALQKKQDEIIVQRNQILNNTIQEGQIAETSGNKSYQSILPFVHQNGVLRDKKQKIKIDGAQKNQKLMIVSLKTQNGLKINNQKKPQPKASKVDMAVVANSSLFQEDESRPKNIKMIQQNEVNLLDDILNMSEIHEPVNAKPILKLQKAAQQVQVQDLQIAEHKKGPKQGKVASHPIQIQPENIIIPPIVPIVPIDNKSSKKLGFMSKQMHEKIEPHQLSFSSQKNNQKSEVQVIQKTRQIVHAPKVYKSNKFLNANQDSNEGDPFDNQLQKREEQLNRIRKALLRTNQINQNVQIVSRSHKRNKSKQSIKGYIDDIRSKHNKDYQNPNNLVVEQIKSQAIRDKALSAEEEDQIQVISINPLNKINEQILVGSAPIVEQNTVKTIKNADNQDQSKRDYKRSYNPSEISRRTQIQPLQAVAKRQNSLSSHQNIFDRRPYAETEQQQVVLLPYNQTQKSFIGTQKINEPKKTQKSQISYIKTQVKQNSEIISEQQVKKQTQSNPSEQEKQVDNQYVINIQRQKSNAATQKQSESIRYQPSRTNKQDKDNYSVNLNLEKEVQERRQDIQNINQEENLSQNQYSKYDAPDELNYLQQDQSRQEQPFKPRQQHSNIQNEELMDAQLPQISNYTQQINKHDQTNLAYQQDNHLYVNERQPSEKGQQSNNHFKAEEIGQSYQSSKQDSQQHVQQRQHHLEENPNLFRVQYADNNLQPQEYSHKDFTVEHVNNNYIQVENYDNISQSNQLSLQLRKTSKKQPVNNKPQNVEHQPIQFVDGKTYVKLEVPDEDNHTIPGRIRRSQDKHKPIVESQPIEPQKMQTNKDQIIDLLKNVNKRVRSKKSMPKEEKDERIAVNLEKNIIPRPKMPQENTNLTRKSMEKNKPINQFKFQHKNQEYGQDEEEYSTNYRNPIVKNTTNVNLVRPSIIDRSSSLRQSNTTDHLGQKRIIQAQNSPQKPKEPRMQEIRQFNFGDEFSSDRSKNPASSEAELVKWKQQFVKQGSYVNFEPQYERNQIPQLPILSKVKNFDEDDDLQVIEQRKISRKKSKKSKQKPRKESKERKSQLEKIYGR